MRSPSRKRELSNSSSDARLSRAVRDLLRKADTMRSDEPGQKVSERVEQYLRDSGYSADGYEERRFRVSVGPLVLTFPNPGRLRYHDLHHVVSGYRTGLVGEAEVSIYELRGGCPTKLILFLCLGSIGIGTLLSPRRVVKAWRNA